MTRFFTTLAAVAVLGTGGFAQASSQADGPPFEIKPHHTGISVPNLEESIAWYQKMLGFQIVRRVSPNANIAIALMRRNDCYIELFQVTNAQPLLSTAGVQQPTSPFMGSSISPSKWPMHAVPRRH